MSLKAITPVIICLLLFFSSFLFSRPDNSSLKKNETVATTATATAGK
ncbi:hypothetical protein [Bdellovibrio sp. NC01]|nr:hypothetical protein [Bdellovibrio sp. NC01]